MRASGGRRKCKHRLAAAKCKCRPGRESLDPVIGLEAGNKRGYLARACVLIGPGEALLPVGLRRDAGGARLPQCLPELKDRGPAGPPEAQGPAETEV